MLPGRHRMRRRFAVISARHRDPAQAFAAARHQLGKSRLGDRRHRADPVGVVAEVVGHGARIGGYRHRADPGAGIPGQQGFGAVVQVNKDEVAGGDTALLQSTRDAAHALQKLPVTPGLARAVERCPDQKRVVAPRLDALLEQARYVHSRKRMELVRAQKVGHGVNFQA